MLISSCLLFTDYFQPPFQAVFLSVQQTLLPQEEEYKEYSVFIYISFSSFAVCTSLKNIQQKKDMKFCLPEHPISQL